MDMHDGPPPTCCKYTYWSLATITSAAVIAKFVVFMISNTDDPDKFRSIPFLINFIIATTYESLRVLIAGVQVVVHPILGKWRIGKAGVDKEMRLGKIEFWLNDEKFHEAIEKCDKRLKFMMIIGAVYIGFMIYAGYFTADPDDQLLSATLVIIVESFNIFCYGFILIFRKFYDSHWLYYSYKSVDLKSQKEVIENNNL